MTELLMAQADPGGWSQFLLASDWLKLLASAMLVLALGWSFPKVKAAWGNGHATTTAMFNAEQKTESLTLDIDKLGLRLDEEVRDTRDELGALRERIKGVEITQVFHGEILKNIDLNVRAMMLQAGSTA